MGNPNYNPTIGKEYEKSGGHCDYVGVYRVEITVSFLLLSGQKGSGCGVGIWGWGLGFMVFGLGFRS